MRCGYGLGGVAAPAIATATSATTRATREFLNTNPPSARGPVSAHGRSSDSGHPLRRLPGPRASGVVAEGISPHSGGTVPDLHRVPFPRTYVRGREPIIGE